MDGRSCPDQEAGYMANKGKIAGIAAWALAGLLAVAAVVLGVSGQRKAGKIAAQESALRQIAETAGLVEADPNAPKDEAQQSEAVKLVEETIVGLRAEVAAAAEALTAAAGETARAKEASAGLERQVEELKSKAGGLEKDLAARAEELAAARKELEDNAKEVEGVRASVEKAKEEAEKAKEEMRSQVALVRAATKKEVAKYREEIEALKAAAGGAVAEEAGGEEEIWVDALVGGEPERDMGEGRVVGTSQMFSMVRYGMDEVLRFEMLDGQRLTYDKVPMDAVDKLVQAYDTLDNYYKFRIQGIYKSTPPDGVVVRKYWKWFRRHRGNAKEEVRYVGPETVGAAPEGVAQTNAAQGQ